MSAAGTLCFPHLVSHFQTVECHAGFFYCRNCESGTIMPFSAAALHAAPPDFTVCSRCDVKANPYESRRPRCCCDASAALRQRQREAAASWCGETTENKQAHSHRERSARRDSRSAQVWRLFSQKGQAASLIPKLSSVAIFTGDFLHLVCFIGILCDRIPSIHPSCIHVA